MIGLIAAALSVAASFASARYCGPFCTAMLVRAAVYGSILVYYQTNCWCRNHGVDRYWWAGPFVEG